MMVRRLFCFAVAALCTFGSGMRAVSADAPVAYDTFVKGATAQHGLFTLWHKDGKLYIELTAAQLNHDYVQTIVPSSGVGGQFVVAGNTDHLPSELVRFESAGDQVAIVWANPYFVAPNSPASQLAIARNFPRSIVGLANVAARDAANGTVVVDAAPFLQDQLNLKAVLAQNIHDTPKADPYTLDSDRTYFGVTKSFPKNVVIEALQDWTSETQHLEDAIPDPRHLQMHVTYNIADITPSPDYRPRYADDRVGIYDDIYLTFDHDEVISRKLRYLVRWNLAPSDPSKPISPAKHPMVFVMSNTIPEKYREPIKAAVLKWNAAFEKLGISNALQVVPQPNDPNFDPDDIRYNVLRWVTEESASFGADSQTLFDPRTGEEFRTGILISADVPLYARQEWTFVIDPVRNGRSTDPMPQKFLDDVWLGTIMHETGHNLGMQHNFVGSRAYTAKELQDTAFTEKYGIASTVMEYAPTNVWPKSDANGTYSQTVLGPYDYYAMRYAYGTIPGAATPEAEIPALEKLASAWSDPKFRYASDEDVSWGDGHAADPRAEQGILTDDMLGWCDTQFGMNHALMNDLDRYQPADGAAYEDESRAFGRLFGANVQCATFPVRFLGGQYISRAHRGDPGAEPPIVPVPRADQERAFRFLDDHLFSSAAWTIAPSVLSNLTYSEWAGYGYVNFEGYGNLPKWAYDPPARHDYPYAQRISAAQNRVIDTMFSTPVLARMASGAAESRSGTPMRLADLFAWAQTGILGDLSASAVNVDELRRPLQVHYVQRLVALFRTPDPDAPSDVSALARAALAQTARLAGIAESRAADPTVRAHVALLRSLASEALQPKGN